MKCLGLHAFSGACVELSGGVLLDGVEELIAPPPAHTYLAPGFIDVQVNGFAGVDYCNPDAPQDEIARSLEVLFSTGVTRLFPTVITGSPEAMLGALRNLARARRELRHGHAFEGFHVEGPHISPHDGPRGAHPRRWVRPPDIGEFRRWQEATGNQVRIVTLAPDWPQSVRYIEAVTAEGVVV